MSTSSRQDSSDHGDPDSDQPDISCPCSKDTSSTESLVVDCKCPRDDHDIIVHETTCLLFKEETVIYKEKRRLCECPPYDTVLCTCCSCPKNQCACDKTNNDKFDEWRKQRDTGNAPPVLDSSHPLMQKFQESLRKFLEKENEMAEQEIIALRDDLKLKKQKYDDDLEDLYRNDHNTNAQRVLIKDYEDSFENETKARIEAQDRAKVVNEEYKRCKEKFNQDLRTERKVIQEYNSLKVLIKQMEEWREETKSDIARSQTMTKSMRREKRQRADEKRKLDMYVYAINTEIWKIQSKTEFIKKQYDLKKIEMEKLTDKIIAYSTELEDLELDKKRLTSLWSAVLTNIKHRDNVYDLVRKDYWDLQENYATLKKRLEGAKRDLDKELQKSKSLALQQDKLNHDLMTVSKSFKAQGEKNENLIKQIADLKENVVMLDGDYNVIKMENKTLQNILSTTITEYEKRCALKIEQENQVLQNYEDCVKNDKAVESMCWRIKRMRQNHRYLEMWLTRKEIKYCRVIAVIGVHMHRRLSYPGRLAISLEELRQKEKECNDLEQEFKQTVTKVMHTQWDLDKVLKKHKNVKDISEIKTSRELRIEDLERHCRIIRRRTNVSQQEWMTLQGHVVKLTNQYHKLVSEINLVYKQILICDAKVIYANTQLKRVQQERFKGSQVIRNLEGRLQMLERACKETKDHNDVKHRNIVAVSYEYTANLKDAESELVQLEEDTELLVKEKEDLAKDIDRSQREIFVWQRKGIQALDLKKIIQNAETRTGDIGRLKGEIHRMELRRDHLRRTADKLSEELAMFVLKREAALEKTRASAAVEKAKGLITNTTQAATYKHRLRLAKENVTRVTKELVDANEKLKGLEEEASWLQQNNANYSVRNSELEERVAEILERIQEALRNKQWVLERVVRTQRLGAELTKAIKRQSLRIKKPKESVLEDFNAARELNDKLKYITNSLLDEFPYLKEKLLVILNTLDIESPSGTPRLVEDATCDVNPTSGDQGCVIPELGDTFVKETLPEIN